MLLSAEYSDERRALVGEEAAAEVEPGLGRLPRIREAVATRGLRRADARRHRAPRRRRPLRQRRLRDAERRLAPELAGDPRARLAARHAGADVLARGGARRRRCVRARGRARRSRPGLALRDGKPYLAWGTPGGDQQEQWALHVFLRHVDLGLDLQAAIDAPEFHTDHLISSFYPRGFAPRSLSLESRVRLADGRRPPAARARRARSGRRGRSGASRAVAREPDGLLKAGANPRGMQGYAVGR